MSSPQLHYYTVGEKVTAFSSTRYGGCSEGNYRSFNVNRYCGDDEEHIARNLESLKSLLGVSQVFMPHQVHGTEVLRVKQSVPWRSFSMMKPIMPLPPSMQAGGERSSAS